MNGSIIRDQKPPAARTDSASVDTAALMRNHKEQPVRNQKPDRIMAAIKKLASGFGYLVLRELGRCFKSHQPNRALSTYL